MSNRGLKRDAVIALLSGYLGTKVMDPVTTKLQTTASEADKQQEKAVSPGVAYDVAARKISQVLGFALSDDGVKTVGAGFHQGIGLSAGVLYVALRRGTSLGPLAAGVLVVLVFWAGIDEGVNSLFGFTAPPDRYPMGTHVRGLLGHVALGVGTVVSAEVLSTLLGRSARS